jgi:cell division septum initiation protein DivIVA
MTDTLLTDIANGYNKLFDENEKLRQQLAGCQAREKVLRDALKESYDEDGLCVDPDDFVKQDDSTALDTMLKEAKREVLNDEAAAWADIKLHAAKIGDDWLGTFADTMLAAITKELE